MTEHNQRVYPVALKERIELLDVIRGIALLGILLANMVAFSSPAIYSDILNMPLWDGTIHGVANIFVDWFVQGKFYTTFSFLFGVGFMIFLVKAEQKGYRPKRLFARRLTVLLVIGLLHALLIWWGDILTIYALCGYLLLLFYRASAKSLIWFVWLFFMIGIGLVALTSVIGWWTQTQMPELVNDQTASIIALYDSAYQAYSSGTWGEILSQNLIDWSIVISNIILAPFSILPMFLLGAYAYKRGVITNPRAHISWLRQIWVASLIIGIIFSLAKYVFGSMEHPLASIVEYIGSTFGDASLSIFYMSTITLLYLNGFAHRFFSAIGNVGLMALTNYLTQSIVCTFIFYHFGLGLYGIGFAWTVIIAVLIYTIQVLYSRLWFTRFSWGPMEWLWRKLTYGQLKPKDE